MVKSLLNRIVKGVQKGIVLAGAMVSLSACPNFLNINYAPETNLSVNPASIKRGGNVQFNIDGKDQNGKKDIIEYKLEIDRDNDGIIDEIITQSTPIEVTRTFDEIGTARIYGSCVDSEGLTDRKGRNVIISPSNLPAVTLNPEEIIEGATKTIILPSPVDDDTEGEIPYLSATTSQGGITSTLSGNKLTLHADSISQDSPYQVKLTFGSESGGINTATLEGTIRNLCDVSGILQDNENDYRQEGEIKLLDGDTFLEDILNSTENDGTFNLQTKRPISNVIVKAKFGDSYVRTISLDGTRDYSNLIIRAVPAPTFCSKEEFRTFMRDINDGYSGLKRWDFSQFQGIEILMENPDPTKGAFTEEQQYIIAEKIRSSSNIERFVDGRQLDEYIQIDKAGNIPPEGKENHYVYGDNQNGWIVVIPDEIMYIWGVTGLSGVSTGLINFARIKLQPNQVNYGNPTVDHEFGHGFTAIEGEAKTLRPYTIMYSKGAVGPVISTPGFADEKAGKLIYEDTYLPKEKLDDILGIEF